MKSTFTAPSWCSVCYSCYLKFSNHHWSELPRLCQNAPRSEPCDVCILTGFLSGVVGIYTEHERAKDWVNEQFNPFARWTVYDDGWLTIFTHQGRNSFDSFFGKSAPSKLQEVIDGIYTPKDVLKPLPRNRGMMRLKEPDLADCVMPSGELLVTDKGILHILADGSCLRPNSEAVLQTVTSSVIFRKNWLVDPFFKKNGNYH